MIVAVTMVKDEADVIAATVGHMKASVDHVIVADNGSTDGTREILDGLDVEVVDDPEVGYYQSRKMSALAEKARQMGATWVVPFDADEVWLGREYELRETLEGAPPEAHIVEAILLDHVATGADPDLPNVIASMPWRRTAIAPLRKVAVRAVEGVVIHQGNHGADFAGIRSPLTVTGGLEIRHFPYRSAAQFIKKARNGAAAYAATDLPENAGGHWRGYGRILEEQGEAACASVFRKWFWRADPTREIEIDGERQPPLVRDPCLLRS